ncbi:hypothetical protein QYM36_006181 [Artemia franciscana]|uniref:tRNA synthetases class I catalytic domain-containing protein n=2 Tax=Artemia franciscana TaxID=6661 RepID=A0AA88L9H6_ARTSF|nr:hypothetical protein QYM36_006181 [Artemia franciscana]
MTEKIQLKRTFDPINALDIHFRIAEAEFRRLCTTRNVVAVTLNQNRAIEAEFRAKQEEFMKLYGEDAPEAKAILAFHGTPTISNIENILTKNFKDKYIVKCDYGYGHYFTEFPDEALDYAGETNALILCLILPGDPSWESPWGMGRPGRHIECSAMASDILEQSIDIPAGGIDLLHHSHHNNELAQSEACFSNDNWVRYFLHTGNLKIQDYKMSKSLKNFTTIEEALKKHKARQIRLICLLHHWRNDINYSEIEMKKVLNTEKIFDKLFNKVKSILREKPEDFMVDYQPFTVEEKTLLATFRMKKNAVDAAL